MYFQTPPVQPRRSADSGPGRTRGARAGQGGGQTSRRCLYLHEIQLESVSRTLFLLVLDDVIWTRRTYYTTKRLVKPNEIEFCYCLGAYLSIVSFALKLRPES